MSLYTILTHDVGVNNYSPHRYQVMEYHHFSSLLHPPRTWNFTPRLRTESSCTRHIGTSPFIGRLFRSLITYSLLSTVKPYLTHDSVGGKRINALSCPDTPDHPRIIETSSRQHSPGHAAPGKHPGWQRPHLHESESPNSRRLALA